MSLQLSNFDLNNKYIKNGIVHRLGHFDKFRFTNGGEFPERLLVQNNFLGQFWI